MPTATVEMLVDKKYIVVGFRPKVEEVNKARRWPPLPTGLYDFAPTGCLQTPLLVTLRLAKDERGKADVLDMLVAADYLRDAGWAVEPLGWCRTVFEAVEGTLTPQGA